MKTGAGTNRCGKCKGVKEATRLASILCRACDHPNELVDEYAKTEQTVRNLLHQFDAKLEAHKKAFMADKKNWGYVGDLHNYASKLEDMLGLKG